MGKIDLIAVSPIQPSESKAAQRFVLYALLALPAFLTIAFAGAWGVSRWKEAQAAPKTPNTAPKPEAKNPVREPKGSPSGKPASTQGVKPAPAAPPPNRTAPPSVPPTRSSQAPNPANPTSNPALPQNHDGLDEDDAPTVLFDPPSHNPSTGKPLGGHPPNTPLHKPGSQHKDKTGGPKPISTAYSQDDPSKPATNKADEDHVTPPSPTELGKSWEAGDHSPSHPSKDSDIFGQGQEDGAESGLPPKLEGWATPEGWAFTPPSSDPAAGPPSHHSDHSGEAVDPDATNVYTPHVARNRPGSQPNRDPNGAKPTSHTEEDVSKQTIITLNVGDQVGENYKILEIIGKGGAGTVYKVQHTIMEEIFALKVLNNNNLAGRFINEAKVTIGLHNENIVKVFPIGKDNYHNFFYLLMDFIDGCNLKKYLRKTPEITYGEILHILKKVCAGLKYAHEKKTCHRDIKPENIMISKGEGGGYPHVSIVDFGLSKLKKGKGNLTQYGGAGTPKYMAPEQFAGRGDPDFRADIYSVGVLSFFMLSGGELPKEYGRTNINEVNGRLPLEVGDVLNTAMEFNPPDRYQSISFFYEELRDAMADSGLDMDQSVTMTDEELNLEDPTE
jgi:predicted Ser/Thr protein kinase